jgi:uncharacterized protein YdhG (YjbR/CyaY superfamily)
MTPVQTVDEYIAAAPAAMRERLNELRATIKAAAPDAKESISYAMPTYHYKGRLVYFSLWKKHIGVYGLTSPVLEAHQSELKGLVTPKGTIHFPLNEKLPLELIQKLVQARVKQNEAAEKQK